jgi:hypothetical protein
MDTSDCRCLECKPETLAFSEIIGKPETIEDILKGFHLPTSLRFKLLSMEERDYLIDRITSDNIVFKRLCRDGYYWMRCDCGDIVETPVGKSCTEYCSKCNPQESDLSASRTLGSFLLLILTPISMGLLWILFSTIGILPSFDWPLSIMPLILLGAPGAMLLIWFQIHQYRLKKKRRIIRNLTHDLANSHREMETNC